MTGYRPSNSAQRLLSRALVGKNGAEGPASAKTSRRSAPWSHRSARSTPAARTPSSQPGTLALLFLCALCTCIPLVAAGHALGPHVALKVNSTDDFHTVMTGDVVIGNTYAGVSRDLRVSADLHGGSGMTVANCAGLKQAPMPNKMLADGDVHVDGTFFVEETLTIGGAAGYIAGGRVGVGTVTPACELDVVGDMIADAGAAAGGQFDVTDDATVGGNASFAARASAGSGVLAGQLHSVNATARILSLGDELIVAGTAFVARSSGLVGVNKDDPQVELDVGGTASLDASLDTGSLSVAGNSTMGLMNTAVLRGDANLTIELTSTFQDFTTTDAVVRGSVNVGSDALFVGTAGRVGIATGTPVAELSVDGTMIVRNTTVVTGDATTVGLNVATSLDVGGTLDVGSRLSVGGAAGLLVDGGRVGLGVVPARTLDVLETVFISGHTNVVLDVTTTTTDAANSLFASNADLSATSVIDVNNDNAAVSGLTTADFFDGVTNDVHVGGDLTVDDVLHFDQATGNLGINTVGAPTERLHVVGDTLSSTGFLTHGSADVTTNVQSADRLRVNGISNIGGDLNAPTSFGEWKSSNWDVLAVSGSVDVGGSATMTEKLETGNVLSVDSLGETVTIGRIDHPSSTSATHVAGTVQSTGRYISSTGAYIDLPIGSIILWKDVAPPPGWVILDGSGGAPCDFDMRNRFARAGLDGGAGVTGGTSEHTHNFTSQATELTVNHFPPHSHVIVNHTHTFPNASTATHSHTDSFREELTTGCREDTIGSAALTYADALDTLDPAILDLNDLPLSTETETDDGTPFLEESSPGAAEHSHGVNVEFKNHLPDFHALHFICKLS